jgi:hypothetical protein
MDKKEKNNMETQNKPNEIKVLIYEKDKVEKMLNVLNQITFQGIQQAQIITQIVMILSNPIEERNEIQNGGN